MVAKITKLWEGLKLTEEEKQEITLLEDIAKSHRQEESTVFLP